MPQREHLDAFRKQLSPNRLPRNAFAAVGLGERLVEFVELLGRHLIAVSSSMTTVPVAPSGRSMSSATMTPFLTLAENMVDTP